MKHFIAAAAVTLCAGAVAIAAEQATFILTNGQRDRGIVVFHGGHGYNLIDGNLNLRIGNTEKSYAESDVAVIDFVGGTPSTNELQALPATGHLLALRNGTVQQGTFENIVNGETVQWQGPGGIERYPINQVSRIYLNPQSARTAFNYTGPVGVGTAVATAGQANAGGVQVIANQAWTYTGVMVRKGDRVAFNTTGQINFGRSPGQTSGPDGNGQPAGAAFPVAVVPVGTLIGKVANSAPFPIGSNSQPIVMPADGQLMLGINDNELNDNSGAFTVIVTKR